MRARSLDVAGVWEFTPEIHHDDRGAFLEYFRQDLLASTVGHELRLAQANCSVSSRGVLRGIHFADVPPGQAKFVTCLSGAVFDVAVDLRVGSATFGSWDGVRLDDVDRRCLYLPEGVGHGFMALSEPAVVAYLCSTPYNPAGEHSVHALDPELAIEWPGGSRVQLSPRDADAPSFVSLRDAGLLPTLADCEDLRSGRG